LPNRSPQATSATQVRRTPLSLVLHYLVTPVVPDPLTRHTALGRVLQVCHDNAILPGGDLQGVLAGTTGQLAFRVEELTLEQLSLMWEALSQPYQISVAYVVTGISIETES